MKKSLINKSKTNISNHKRTRYKTTARARTSFWFVFTYGIYLLVFFFLGMIFFHLQPNSNSEFQPENQNKTELKESDFFFFSQNGEMFNLFDNHVHWVEQSWEYLFEGISEYEIETAQEYQEKEEKSGSKMRFEFSDPWSSEEHHTAQVQKGEVEQYFTNLREKILLIHERIKNKQIFKKGHLHEEGEELYGKRFIPLGKYVLRDPTILATREVWVHLLPNYKSCKTPRWYTIAHGESVVAYQQDLNTYDSCNLERRICFDGKLSGTFTAQSCKVNTKYTYYQKKFVAYNTDEKSPLIQPEQRKKFNDHNFPQDPDDVETFIHDVPVYQTTEFLEEGTIYRDEEDEVEQRNRKGHSCRTPRGEKVDNKKFVKAYKHKNGFSDLPCEVQIRMCLNGELEGDFEYDSCTPWNISYMERMDGKVNFDVRPISQKKIDYLKKLRKSEETYTKEYIDDEEFTDEVLSILDHD